MATNIFDMTDTWNNSGTVFNSIKMALTQTASAAGSKLMQLLRNGVSQFAVDPTSGVTVGVPTGDALGHGKINVSGGYYVNGVPILSQVIGSGNFPVFNDTVNGLVIRPIVSTDLPACQFLALGAVKAKAEVVGEVFVALDEGGAFTSKPITAALTGQVRERVSTSRTYFVNATTGNDTFDGSSASVGTFPVGPVATIQKAVDLIAGNLDLLPGASLAISVADGAYTGPITLRSLVGSVLACTITGNPTTPANVTVTSNNAACFGANRSNTTWTLNGFKVVGTGNTAAIGVSAANGSVITLLNFDFGSCTGGHIQSTSTSNISVNSNYTISGGGVFHYNSTTNASLIPGGRTVTVSAAVTFSTAFAMCERSALLLANAMTFVNPGNVTGVRHQCLTMGLLDTQSNNANYFPGTIAGNITPVVTPFGAVMS